MPRRSGIDDRRSRSSVFVTNNNLGRGAVKSYVGIVLFVSGLCSQLITPRQATSVSII